MSYESYLRQSARATEPTNKDDNVVELNDVDDLGSFGWLRGMRERAVMLELRKNNGNILAVGYGWIALAEFNPSEGITLSLGGKKVVIKGRNLNEELRPMVRLFEGIVRHRVPWVQEAGETESMAASETATVIESIEW
jgi:hypothetical protein